MIKSERQIRNKDSYNPDLDWFVPAFQTTGTVADCLNAVADSVSQMTSFVNLMSDRLAQSSSDEPDKLTSLGQKIKLLETSLNTRLSILTPDRKGSWFRNASAPTGPFREGLNTEPVFPEGLSVNYGEVAKGFIDCWNQHTIKFFPNVPAKTSLWYSLLSFNEQLHGISLLKPPESIAKSPSLEAFLGKVHQECLVCRSKLANCYKLLFEASEKFWRVQSTNSSNKKDNKKDHIKDWEEYSNSSKKTDRLWSLRSETIPRKALRLKTSSDLQALKTLGFKDFPEADELKKRYHTLARDMHPDRPGGSEQKFRHLAKAYSHVSKILEEYD